MWSRHVVDSIRTVIQFQLTVTVVISLYAFIEAFIVKEFPLRGLQILWIYLIMSIFALLGFIYQVPTGELSKRKRYSPTAPLITPIMIKYIIDHVVYQLGVLLFILFFGKNRK